MSLWSNLLSLFKRGGNEISRHQFVRAKYDLTESLFEKFQTKLNAHIETAHTLSPDHYEEIINGTKSYCTYAVEAIQNIEHELKSVIAACMEMGEVKQKKKLQKNFDRYQDPTLHQVSHMVLPWFYGRTYEVKKETDTLESGYLYEDCDHLPANEKKLLLKQRREIGRILEVFDPLIRMTPETHSAEELKTYAMDHLKKDNYAELYDVLFINMDMISMELGLPKSAYEP